jgi:hypothetical protein
MAAATWPLPLFMVNNGERRRGPFLRRFAVVGSLQDGFSGCWNGNQQKEFDFMAPRGEKLAWRARRRMGPLRNLNLK